MTQETKQELRKLAEEQLKVRIPDLVKQVHRKARSLINGKSKYTLMNLAKYVSCVDDNEKVRVETLATELKKSAELILRLCKEESEEDSEEEDRPEEDFT